MFELFALRSDGEQKTQICPLDYCLGFALRISAQETVPSTQDTLELFELFALRRDGSKKLKFDVRITAWDLPLGFLLGKITWDTRKSQETVPTTRVTWELFELFALRSDGEQKTEICPRDFCLGFPLGKIIRDTGETVPRTWDTVWDCAEHLGLSQGLGISTWENHLGCS